MLSDPKSIALAFLGGLIPALIWLFFWLREDRKRPEPRGLLILTFIVGMLGVVIVLPIQKFFQVNISGAVAQLVGYAGAEEIVKFLIVLFLIKSTRQADEPLDWPIYLLTGALGFAALENTLFLLEPVTLGKASVGLMTGHLRFLGATLLHAVTSGIIGIGMGLSFFKNKFMKTIYIGWGLVVAIALHSIFNFLIIKNNGSDFLKVFAFLWVTTVIVMLLFEKLRKISR